MCLRVRLGVLHPGYGVLPPELARDAAAAAAAAASMSHLASLGSLSPGGLAYARAAMVCPHLIYVYTCTASSTGCDNISFASCTC